MSQKPQWLTPAGSIGTYVQGVTTSLVFAVVGATDFDIIAGQTPGYFGFHITTGTTLADVTTLEVRGTPYVFNENVTEEFVLRAYNDYGVTDRTFTISVTGPTALQWITPAGYLQVGPNLETYAFNKNFVDYTLQASTQHVPAGQKLSYYIGDNDGQLPPGLSLDQNTGRITGYVQDQLTIDFLASKIGGFDGEFYDTYPYDHAIIINDRNKGQPTSFSKVYQFYVTATDGLSSARQQFKIRVDDPNEFRADTTQIDADTTIYEANVGYLISPLWLGNNNNMLSNPSNLGVLRANNQHIIDLNVYDPYPFTGPISFDWDTITVNPEVKMVASSESDLTGSPTSNLAGQQYIIVSSTVGSPLANMFIQLNTYVPNANNNIYQITKVEAYGATGYRLTLDQPLLFAIPDVTNLYCGTRSTRPPALHLDSEQGIIYGRIPYQPAYSINYRFTVTVTKMDQDTGTTLSNNHIFNLTLQGDIESNIKWVTPNDLGGIIPGYTSELAVQAVHIPDGNLSVSYVLTGGKLPSGLSLGPDGSIIGSVPQQIQTEFDLAKSGDILSMLGFTNSSQLATAITIFDQGKTTFDRVYKFNITARDTYLLSAISQDFTLAISDQTAAAKTKLTNIYVQPLLSKNQRLLFKSLVEDLTIFNPSLIYRLDDLNFGIQPQVRMGIEYGIEEIDVDNYVPALTTYFKRRRYYFGDVKSAQAVDSSGNILYDVVYLDIVDDQMINNSISVSPSFSTVVNGATVTYYPDSVLNEQSSLESINVVANTLISVDTGRRPKFMQTLQKSTGVPLGFVKASILCYTLPNQSSKIIDNIANSGFDFKNIDFEIDRITLEDARTLRTSIITTNIGDTEIPLGDVSGLAPGMIVTSATLKGIPYGTTILHVSIANSSIILSQPVTMRFPTGSTFVFDLGTKQLVFGTSLAAGGGGVSSSFYIDTESFDPAKDPTLSNAQYADQDIDTEDGVPLSL